MTDFIDVDGIRTAYFMDGKGQDVLFLHGWGVDHSSFAPVMERMSKVCRCIAPDFPGFGQTPEPGRPWSSADFARFAAAFIREMNLKNPVVVGHSNGGRTAIRLLGEGYPNVKKLVLTGAAGLKPKRGMGYHIRNALFKCFKLLLSPPFLKGFRERLVFRFGSEDYRRASPLMKKTMITLLNEDLRGLLPNIKVPTLLVWGENDTAAPFADAKIMEKEIPNAGLVAYKNSGHYAFIQNLPNFCNTLEYFITH